MTFRNQNTIAPDHASRHVTCSKTEDAVFRYVSQFGTASHESKRVAGAQYDIDRLGWRIDVKGKERTVPCLPEYSTDTHAYQDEFECDIYVFASYNTQADAVELMGWEWKDEYLADADFVPAGAVHDGRKNKVDGHKMQYKNLRQMEDLRAVMSGEFWLIKNKDHLNERLKFLSQWLLTEWDWDHAVQLTVKRYVVKRSLSQNALFHVWCREMAEHFAGRGAAIDQDEMKELMKYKFLGTSDLVINNTVIPDQIRRTSKLDAGEMMHFMDQVQAWAMDHGVKLTCPVDSEYMRLRGG